jgi:hypothetical protein
MCLEVVLLLQPLSQDPVVVDFAVDGQGNGAIIVDEGLRSGVCCEFSMQIRKREAWHEHEPTPTIHKRS